MTELELNYFNEPDKVIVLTYNTTIKVIGECHVRYIHMDIGCETLIIEGEGKLVLHPKDEDRVAFGIPPLNIVTEHIWKVNNHTYNINIECKEIAIESSDKVQWFGVYGLPFNKWCIHVSEDTSMPNGYQYRCAPILPTATKGYIAHIPTQILQTPEDEVYSILQQTTVLTALRKFGVTPEDYALIPLIPFDDLLVYIYRNVFGILINEESKQLGVYKCNLTCVVGILLSIGYWWKKLYNTTFDFYIIVLCLEAICVYEKIQYPYLKYYYSEELRTVFHKVSEDTMSLIQICFSILNDEIPCKHSDAICFRTVCCKYITDDYIYYKKKLISCIDEKRRRMYESIT